MRETHSSNEVVFKGVKIYAIGDFGPSKPLMVVIAADHVQWLEPEHASANERGWVHHADTTLGEFEFDFDDENVHRQAVEQLHTWQQARPSQLMGFTSEQRQYFGLVDKENNVAIGKRLGE